ncbi:MAG: aminopeptidase P family protein [Actinobacteria bacterium]|nr:aminopeptidase P family protein [Actinomycetota bacterium]
MLETIRKAIEDLGARCALVTHPETLSALRIFDFPARDWPVSNPFVPLAAALAVGPGGARLVVADFHASDVIPGSWSVATYRAYDFQRPPMPLDELSAALTAALRDVGADPQATVAYEARHLPMSVGTELANAGFKLVPADESISMAHPRHHGELLAAVTQASRLADIAQEVVKEEARPGITEVELAGLAATAIDVAAGHRVSGILTVSAGAEGTCTGGWVSTGRRVTSGDLVLTDVAPWLAGGWSDSANTVVVGEPDSLTRERFDAIKRALHKGIELCSPGAVARDVDRQVRSLLESHGPTYSHHTGHALGASWSEEPRITPYCELAIEEGMILALEPAIYEPGWGGIRLEHVFVVEAGGNRILTEFDHTL